MSVFGSRNGNQAEYVSRSEAAQYASDFQYGLDALKERVGALEELAATLRQGRAPQSAPAGAQLTKAGDPLTKGDAMIALDELREAGAREFERLSNKIDYAVSGVRDVLQRSDDITTATGPLPRRSTLDYAAVAFGLSEIKRQVTAQLGQAVGSTALMEEYRGTVQYFADVFAKADPAFDADAFKRQAGV